MYGWAVAEWGERVRGRPRIVRKATGGGRVMAADNWVPSARAEALALLALLAAVRPALKEGHKLTVHIDNKAVVDCFAKKSWTRARAWAKQKDRDIWDWISAVLDETDAWRNVRVEKVAAHQDTKTQTSGPCKGRVKSNAEISDHEWGNILADEIVGEHHRSGLIAELAQPDARDEGEGRRAAYPARVRVGWGQRWCHAGAEAIGDHVKLQHHQRHVEASESRELEGKAEDWMKSRDWARGHNLKAAWYGPRKARRDTQIWHGWLPTRSAMARRHYPCVEAAICPCDRVEETQWHAIGRCTHPHSKQEREQGANKINLVLAGTACKRDALEALHDWYRCEDGLFPEPKMTTKATAGWQRGADEAVAKNMATLGARQAWSGAIPNGMHGKLVHQGGMTEGAADALLAKVSGMAIETSRAVWKARCAWVNEIETHQQLRNRWRRAVWTAAGEWGLPRPDKKALLKAKDPVAMKLWREVKCEGARRWHDEQQVEAKIARMMRSLWSEGVVNSTGGDEQDRNTPEVKRTQAKLLERLRVARERLPLKDLTGSMLTTPIARWATTCLPAWNAGLHGCDCGRVGERTTRPTCEDGEESTQATAVRRSGREAYGGYPQSCERRTGRGETMEKVALGEWLETSCGEKRTGGESTRGGERDVVRGHGGGLSRRVGVEVGGNEAESDKTRAALVAARDPVHVAGGVPGRARGSCGQRREGLGGCDADWP